MQNKRSPGSQNDIDLHGNMSVGEGEHRNFFFGQREHR